MFFAKIWFVKTSTRIVKDESQVVKLNPDVFLKLFAYDQKCLPNAYEHQYLSKHLSKGFY